MADFLLEPVERWWRCPSCDTVDRTARYDAHTQMHNCAGLNGLSVPLVEVPSQDTRPYAAQIPVEREDYIGSEIGASRISAVRTERGDGSNDVTVLVPTANLSIAQQPN